MSQVGERSCRFQINYTASFKMKYQGTTAVDSASSSSSTSNPKLSFTGYLPSARAASLHSCRSWGSNPRDFPTARRFGAYGSFPSCLTASNTRERLRARSPGGKPDISKASFQVQPSAQAVTVVHVEISLSNVSSTVRGCRQMLRTRTSSLQNPEQRHTPLVRLRIGLGGRQTF